jgi:transposase
MSSFIRKKKTKSGATAIQIIYKHGRIVTGLKHIGTAHNDAELEILLALAHEKMHERQLTLNFEEMLRGADADLRLEKSYSALLWETLSSVYDKLNFGCLDDLVFKQLVLARIIEPTSKLDTIRVLADLGLNAPSNSGIHRCLRNTIDKGYREHLSEACFRYVKPAALRLVLYDVTTLYFEIQKEDEYRKSGLSKERRLEPQITVGLLVDRTGFPLEIQSFEGNRAEVKTLLPVLSGFKERHILKDITVTADAAMLSAGNISELERFGYCYVIGSRIAKTPYEIEEYLCAEDAVLEDGQIFESSIIVTVDGKRTKRRVVYQYRAKRAALDLSNIDKSVAKAQKIVEKKADIKRNRFLTVKGDKREINVALVEEARRKAGVKGYVTNLRIPAQEVINAYHQLFQVEKSFRMSKSDLKARPVFHHKRDSIDAHLTVVFAALAVARYIETMTGLSIKKFIRMLAPIRTGVISVNGVSLPIKPQIPSDVTALLKRLKI